jgi:hypothetical protein
LPTTRARSWPSPRWRSSTSDWSATGMRSEQGGTPTRLCVIGNSWRSRGRLGFPICLRALSQAVRGSPPPPSVRDSRAP